MFFRATSVLLHRYSSPVDTFLFFVILFFLFPLPFIDPVPSSLMEFWDFPETYAQSGEEEIDFEDEMDFGEEIEFEEEEEFELGEEEEGEEIEFDDEMAFEPVEKPVGMDIGGTGLEAHFGGYLEAEFSFDVEKEKQIQEDLFEMHDTAFLEARGDYSSRLRFYISGKGEYDLWKGEHTETNYDSELYEAYADFTYGDLDIRFGQQIVSWGTAEFLAPTDNINPLRFEGFAGGMEQVQEMKQPIPMVRADYYLGDYKIEGIFIPFFQEMEIHLFGRDYAVIRDTQFFLDIPTIEMTMGQPLPDYIDLNALDEVMKRRIQEVVRATEYPADNFQNSEAALRLMVSKYGWDASVRYFYTIEDFPTWTIDPTLMDMLRDQTIDDLEFGMLTSLPWTGLIKGEFKRQHIYGLDFTTTVWNMTLKAEGAYFDDKMILTTDFDFLRRRAVFYSAGFDYIVPGEMLTILGQYMQQIVEDKEGDDISDMLWVGEFDAVMGGFMGRFFGDTLKPAIEMVIAGMYFPGSGDYALMPSFKYNVNDRFSITAGANVFEAPLVRNMFTDKLTPLGMFAHNDQVYCIFRFSF